MFAVEGTIATAEAFKKEVAIIANKPKGVRVGTRVRARVHHQANLGPLHQFKQLHRSHWAERYVTKAGGW
jgi:hypothetical protein